MNTTQLVLTALSYLAFLWIGWAGQLWRENGLAETRRELRQAYRDYDELLTLIHHSPVMDEAVTRLPVTPVRVEARHLSIVRGEGA